jgi:hypothetical protein
MSSPQTLRRVLLLLAPWVLLSHAAGAQTRDESERWVPSLALKNVFLGQRVEGDIASSDITWTRTVRTRQGGQEIVTQVPMTAPLRPPSSGDDVLLSALVGGDLELMTPGWQAIPGRPRLFAHGGVFGAFGQTSKVTREGDPTGLPDPLPTTPLQTEETVQGTGSEITAEIEPFAFGVGGGVAFGFDVAGRRLRVKPSIEFMQEEIQLEGRLFRAVQTDTGGPLTALPSRFFGVSLESETTEVFRGLGPGLEVEMDTLRAGPFMLSLFAGGQAYKILGDTKVDMQQSVVIEDPALTPPGVPQTAATDFTFEKNPWSFSGAVGLRFRWLPE